MATGARIAGTEYGGVDGAMNWIEERADGWWLRIRVVPRASRDGVAGSHGDALKIRLRAPPVDQKANEALRRFLADRLDLPRSAMVLESGAGARNKRIRVTGISADEIRKRLSAD